MDGRKVYCAIASYERPEWGFILSKDCVFKKSIEAGIKITMRLIGGSSLICRVRNELLADFIAGDHEYLLSLDDDLELPENTIIDLLEADKDIIGGFYRIKDILHPKTAVRVYENGPEPCEILKKEMVIPVIYVSTGIMLVKREVVERMIEHYKELHYLKNVTNERRWGLYQPYIYQNEYLSEDWAFCQRARDIGFEVWAHGGIRADHWGKHKYCFGE